MGSTAAASSPTSTARIHLHRHPDNSSEFSFFAKTPELVFAAIWLEGGEMNAFTLITCDPAPSGIAPGPSSRMRDIRPIK
jgi:hypothetical protein